MSEQQDPAVTPSTGKFALQRIYVKDLSFESPGAPQCFRDEWKPEIKLDLNTENRQVDDKTVEVTLHITITVKNQDKVAFLVEVQQAGLFLAEGFPPSQLQSLLGSYCPTVLFPYARETVSDVVNRGSFPQLLLAPVNFDALFAEAVKRRADEAQKEAVDSTTH
ncbi:MAG: protein-export chaperone SecB [Gammaproteobacteria bacterium]|nr:protein-export chaperone SecB [Gammaproteobacteria bacterium]